MLNQHADKEDFDGKQKEVEGVCMPLLMAMYTQPSTGSGSSTVDASQATTASVNPPAIEIAQPPAASTAIEIAQPPAASTAIETAQSPAASTSIGTAQPPAASTAMEIAQPPAASTAIETAQPSAASTAIETAQPSAASTALLEASNSHLASEGAQVLEMSILPTTPWHRIPLTRSYLEELLHNPNIRSLVPEVTSIADDVRDKVQELKFDPAATEIVAKLDDNGIASIVAYTHDLGLGERDGNLYFELNNSLRDRKNREKMMKTWGVVVHYTLRALAQLPDVEATCFRGISSGKNMVLDQYLKGRPIQFGAFTSTTTSLDVARGFVPNKADGVIFKMEVLSGKTVHALSLIGSEDEVLLSPSHKFIVTSNNGGYEVDGFTTIDLLQMSGDWYAT